MIGHRHDVAVVTGGASGFGLALGEGCAARDMDVVLLDRDIELVDVAAAALSERYAVRVEARRADVGSSEDLLLAADHVAEQFGAVDILFVNVGVQLFGSIETLTDDEWRWVLDVNVVGTARTVRSFLPLLRRSDRARIAFTSSRSVLSPNIRLGAYQASKAALVTLAETLRMELEPDGIGVTVLFPAAMRTRHRESSFAARPSSLSEVESSADDFRAMMASRPLSAVDFATPDAAARHAIDEVLAGEPYVVTHGDPADEVRQHHAAIDRAVQRIPNLPDTAVSDEASGSTS